MTSVAFGTIALLLIASALLTTAAAAAFQISPSRLRTLREEGFRGSDALARLRAEAARVRTGIRLVTKGLNLTALGMAVATGTIAWGVTGASLHLLGGIAVVLLVTDLVPHLVAARAPVRIALAAAPFLAVLTHWVYLVARPLARLEGALAGHDATELSPEERELREIQDIGEEVGVLEPGESLLVERAFRLDELTAWDAMVPRVDIFAWKDDLPLAEIIGQLPDVPYSRVPLYRESIDDVTGILYVREAYERYARGDEDVPLRELAHDPFFVPGSVSCAQLLRDFQSRRIHMGIVADEFGGTDGLVTLEDVLEELVGEIHDETDRHEEEIVRISETELEADAGADLRDICEILQVETPKVEHRSLNGFILEEMGHVPADGESFVRDGIRIDIVEASDTQVVRARVSRLAVERGVDDD